MKKRIEKVKKITEFGKRLKKCADKTKTQGDFATLLGVDRQKLSAWIHGVNKPAFDNLVKITEIAKVSLDWLMRGIGESELEEFVTIPQVKGKISLGGGFVSENLIEVRVAFRKEWISKKGEIENMMLIRTEGDSMEPTIQSSDLVLIDRSYNYAETQGGLYAVVIKDEIMLKRLQIIPPSNMIKIISDNPKYPPIEIASDNLTINGKAIWFGREIEK